MNNAKAILNPKRLIRENVISLEKFLKAILKYDRIISLIFGIKFHCNLCTKKL